MLFLLKILTVIVDYSRLVDLVGQECSIVVRLIHMFRIAMNSVVLQVAATDRVLSVDSEASSAKEDWHNLLKQNAPVFNGCDHVFDIGFSSLLPRHCSSAFRLPD